MQYRAATDQAAAMRGQCESVQSNFSRALVFNDFFSCGPADTEILGGRRNSRSGYAVFERIMEFT
jgi:hypothetical protein